MYWKKVLGQSTIRVATAALLLTQLLGAAGSVSAAGKDVEVHLIGINDFHGQLDTTSIVSDKKAGTAPILATYLKEAQAKYEHSLLFHNGDSVGASAPVSSLDRDEPTMEWMNMMGFDVASLGNHEFDQGIAALKAQIFGGLDPKEGKVTHAGAKFDYVNANVIETATGKTLIKPYVIKEVGGVKIGFIGLVTKSTPAKVSPSGTAGVRFLSAEEEVEAVNKYAKELQDQGVETIIVLAHDPASTKEGVTTGEAADLAKALPADSPVDVIVAGDNHALANGEVNGKLIVQAFSYGTAFEDIKLMINPATGDVTEKSATVTTTFQEGVKEDPESLAIIKKSLDKHPELTKPVGTTDGSVTRTDAYNNEAALGNLIADSMRHADFGDKASAADFAFMNPGGIRADLPKGDVTFADLAKIQPFGNTLVKLELTGEQIKTLLQQQWGTNADGTPNTKTLQISGLKYTADFNKPVAERVTSLSLEDGTPIDPAKTYTAVVNNFMAAGGDNYKVLVDAKSSLAGPIDLDVFYQYIVDTYKGADIVAKTEGRITNLAASTEETETPVTTEVISRAEFVSALVDMLKLNEVATAPAFKDVAANAAYADAIAEATHAGFIQGYGGNFNPDRDITREEAATILAKLVKDQASDKNAATIIAGFEDGKTVSTYAVKSMAKLIDKGILSAAEENLLQPKQGLSAKDAKALIQKAVAAKAS
ncbi:MULTISPECIES: 5'-nucleotidase C-terminal domain-containing protein [Paenibacillus]|uniref:2',3'-cyclic-nucleotide 2'-phosphodiesterase (5'-nucleotidase family) n=1 Tax=Paenibacillus pabuli TaxID=1472 RepID=A0A855Y5J6_9BACL|nr:MULTISPECIES: 5'-nucleotidase C-terminal domain-containing protein [Paenibacillus]PWW37901.1 2',3'-cyclic-nucleotide 2'-phosphodiesterase (5'-nucleotidase family) [Paenibacillus pabuli]PXW08128.1 2',3'-cyclic-nucleotide 2'-phosphodiesterase (5'-nucleotidase family) [Paenibacillus taichungensis]